MSTSPADSLSTPVDGVNVLGSLSPSRASDFTSCPLLYRFRTINQLPEPPSEAAARGTVVHKVLEDLFDLPGPERTPRQARSMVEQAWEDVRSLDPALATLFTSGADDAEEGWLESCRQVLRRYFDLEDPRRLEPAEREHYVEALLDSKLLLRGFIDRVDVAADGRIRVVDYKTSRIPSEAYEAKALFQLKFYALVIWRTRGVVPAMLQLIYLGSGDILRYVPDEADLLATERKAEAIWRAIRTAQETGEWQPNPGKLCGWCAHKPLCPAFGGTPPPLPAALSATPGPVAAGDDLDLD
ncbi:RecB family exonuclease [Nocardioides sp. NPDC059952]|uniref:RecB family exonuclease n=1 Tax=Nocardioides sp. NPDC059952 TaxID=3347014 RepID=UPI00364A6794